jgi:hypothetical protein
MRALVLIFEKSWRLGGWLVRRPDPALLICSGLADIFDSLLATSRSAIGDQL